MADTTWKRVQYNSTQAAAGSVSAMASGMITLALLDMKEGITDAGWTVTASACDSTTFSLTADTWTSWSNISATSSWCTLASPQSFCKYKDFQNNTKFRQIYMLIYPSSSYYLNVVFSLSPFIYSGSSVPAFGLDSWGHINIANTSHPKYSGEGYTSVPITGYEFTNETIVNAEGGFIFTHRGNSVASNYSDKEIPRIVVSCLPIVNPRKGDFCPVVSFKNCGTASTSLSSDMTVNGLHLMDGSATHKWRGIFWDGFAWKQTKMSLMGLGYTYYTGSVAAGATILGPNTYPESESNKVFAYKANTLSCSPGARFYRGALPDIYITPSNYSMTISSTNESGQDLLARYSLNNLTVLANTSNHIVLSPEVKFFNLITPPVPGYIPITATVSTSLTVDPTTISASETTVTDDITTVAIIPPEAILKAQRQLSEATALLDAAKTLGLDIETTDDSTGSSADLSIGLSANASVEAIYGSPSFSASGAAAEGDTGYRYYTLQNVYINPGQTAYINLNSISSTNGGGFKAGTTNTVELPGEIGTVNDEDKVYLSTLSVYWVSSGSGIVNPSEEKDFKITLNNTSEFQAVIENISTKKTPLALSLQLDRYKIITVNADIFEL